MTGAGRVAVTVHCARRWHRLAELVITEDGGRVVEVTRSAAGGQAAPGVFRNRRCDPLRFPLGDGSDSALAICACGPAHLVDGRKLADALAAGEPVVIAAPIA